MAKNKNSKGKPNNFQKYKVKENSELLPFLLNVLAPKGRNSVKSILAREQVMVNDKVETAYNYSLTPGETVTILKDKIMKAPDLKGLTILYEDEDVIVINKEAGLLSIASPKEKNMTAHRLLMTHVKNQHPKNRIFVVHRLDRDTSGVMMFAKNEQVKRKLQDSWRELVKERYYAALVEGVVKQPEGTVSSYLKESSTLKMYSSPHPNNGQHAVTHYKKVQSNKQFSLLEIHLDTGRKNQIRVHMQDLGHPIVGDKKYGARENAAGRLGLHARVLAFYHPKTGQLMRFKTDVPKIFLTLSK